MLFRGVVLLGVGCVCVISAMYMGDGRYLD